MNQRPGRTDQQPFWLGLLLFSLALLACQRVAELVQPAAVDTIAPATPSLSFEERVGQLTASHTQLVTGEQTDVRIGVVRELDRPDPFNYQWSTTGGIITYGQDSCCITYQAPDLPGAYQVNLAISLDNQVVQRAIVIEVIAPTPTPEPSPTPVLTATVATPGDAPAPTDEPLDSAEAYFERAQSYYIQRNYEKTIQDYTKAIELNYEPLSEPYYNRGYTHYIFRDYDRAIDDFTQAIELNYESLGLVYYNRGNAYYYKGNNRRAIADYTQAIELKYEPLAWLYNNRGLALRKDGQYDKAIADYTQAIELEHEPLNWPYYNRGNAYADQGSYLEAIADFTKALNIDPGSVDAYYARGQAYKELGDKEKAVADFQKVVELGNDFWRQEARTQLQELGVDTQ
jgi:tetratricopeptide (TPR) repeat protein